MTIGVYMRVSTDTQTVRNQRPDLERRLLDYEEDSRWYEDSASGKDTNRPGWQQLWADIESGEISLVLVWKIDRIGRSLVDLVSIVNSLRDRGVGIVSVRDGIIDTTSASGELIFSVFAALAQYERRVIIDRTLAGQARARAEGKTWGGGGNYRIPDAKRRRILDLADSGLNKSDIAALVGVNRRTVRRVISRDSQVRERS